MQIYHPPKLQPASAAKLLNCRDASRHFVGEHFCCGTDALHADDGKQLKSITPQQRSIHGNSFAAYHRKVSFSQVY